jgi:hypothetical protein
MSKLLWPLFARWPWAQSTYELASTKVEGAALAYVLSVDVGSASHRCGGKFR